MLTTAIQVHLCQNWPRDTSAMNFVNATALNTLGGTCKRINWEENLHMDFTFQKHLALTFRQNMKSISTQPTPILENLIFQSLKLGGVLSCAASNGVWKLVFIVCLLCMLQEAPALLQASIWYGGGLILYCPCCMSSCCFHCTFC